MGFRPGDNKPTEEQLQEQERSRAVLVPPGTYVLAFIPTIQVKEIKERRGAKRVNGKVRILDAEPKLKGQVGNHVFLGCSLDTDNPNVARMLGSLCAGMGLTNDDEFDVRNVYEVRRALTCRPLVCELKVTKFNNNDRNDWGRVHWRDKLKPETVQQLEMLREKLIEEFGEVPQQESGSGSDWGGDGDPGPSDADAPSNFF